MGSRDWAEAAAWTWRLACVTFGQPERLDARIEQHIIQHGPWKPFTPEGCVRFLNRRGGTTYKLQRKRVPT